MDNIIKIFRKYRKSYIHKNLNKEIEYNLNTFEFIKIKKIYKRVNLVNFLNSQEIVWTELFKKSELKLKKIDYFINNENYKKFINHKTIGKRIA